MIAETPEAERNAILEFMKGYVVKARAQLSAAWSDRNVSDTKTWSLTFGVLDWLHDAIQRGEHIAPSPSAPDGSVSERDWLSQHRSHDVHIDREGGFFCRTCRQASQIKSPLEDITR